MKSAFYLTRSRFRGIHFGFQSRRFFLRVRDISRISQFIQALPEKFTHTLINGVFELSILWIARGERLAYFLLHVVQRLEERLVHPGGIFQTHRLSNFVRVFQILSHRSRFLPSRIDRIVDALSHRRNTNLFYNLRRGKKRKRERESQRAFIHSKLLGKEEEKSEEDDEERKKNSSSSSSSSSYDDDDGAI